MDREYRRTVPDFLVFAPSSFDGSTHDTGNEHFLVFDGPDGLLMAVWTQSTFEGKTDQRIVFSRSRNGGVSWAPPRTIAGANAEPGTGRGMASWGFPLVTNSGRIYVLYSKHIGVNDYGSHTTGLMAGIFSDDLGATWSAEETIPMPRSKWDNPDPAVPANWIVWQRPRRWSEGQYLAGFTRWASPKAVVQNPHPSKCWIYDFATVEFMRFENVDEHPPVAKLAVSYFMSDDRALRVAPTGFPGHSTVQEPSIVALPDQRLFCTLRTPNGSPYYTVSDDAGRTWRQPDVLRYADTAQPLLHPMSPCPIYPAATGGYFMLIHNHDGHFGRWTPHDCTWHRRPIYLLKGEFRSGAKQPVWFSNPRLLMDNDGVVLGHGGGRTDLAMYASVTHAGDETILWYPERKFFLLGRKLGGILREMRCPQK
jgi:hypothetical protein